MKPRFEFRRVRFVPRVAGVSLLDASAVPGDIALTGERGLSSGLLRLTRSGARVLLTAEQTNGRAAFRWPGSSLDMRIVVDRLVTT